MQNGFFCFVEDFPVCFLKLAVKMENNRNGSTGQSGQSSLFNSSTKIDDISTPSELKFDEDETLSEDIHFVEKKREIEKCLQEKDISTEKWEQLAKSKGGLLIDEFRKIIWPLLVGVTESEKTEPPSLDELSKHQEYNQVVLDVNRSLKRFPPGIPYEQRVALQDQLTVLILRVIIKYPHLKYYQGYHDVAITLLLVCGERASFPLLCRLSVGDAAPLAPFMQDTMKPTQHRLNYLLPIVRHAHAQLAAFLEESTVGTMFALPWYLTWFGHSLNKYADVVRLYDYFLCAPPLFPVYVTAAIVLCRARDILQLECDMAMVHCSLSRLPDDLPFEEILVRAEQLYAQHAPEALELEVLLLEEKEEKRRQLEEERLRQRQREAARRRAAENAWSKRLHLHIKRCLAAHPLLRRLPATLLAATLLVGAAVYYRPHFLPFAIDREPNEAVR